MNKIQIRTNSAPAAIGPYSQAIQIGDFVFGSGQIPTIPSTGDIIDGGIEEQTKQVLENIRGILNSVDLDFVNIVKTTIFMKDLKDFSKVNDIYLEYFKQPYPARSTIEVARLPKDVQIEIEFIAATKISK